MVDDLLETFAGAVRDKHCKASTCQTNPIGRLEDRPLCAKHFDRRARLIGTTRLEELIDAETDPILAQRLERALADAREWDEDYN